MNFLKSHRQVRAANVTAPVNPRELLPPRVGLGALIALYGPDLTVLSGSAAALFPLYEAAVQASLQRAKGFELNTRVVASELGDGAGAVGAALLG